MKARDGMVSCRAGDEVNVVNVMHDTDGPVEARVVQDVGDSVEGLSLRVGRGAILPSDGDKFVKARDCTVSCGAGEEVNVLHVASGPGVVSPLCARRGTNLPSESGNCAADAEQAEVEAVLRQAVPQLNPGRDPGPAIANAIRLSRAGWAMMEVVCHPSVLGVADDEP